MPKPYNPHDKLMLKAREEGFRARSVYKLQELDERFSLLKNGMQVLDVGAAPGSWLQYASLKIGPRGVAIGVDLKEIEPVAANVQTHVLDIGDLEALEQKLQTKKFNLILSDIAPNTTGIPGLDSKRSVELSRMVVDIAKNWLKPSGNLVMKVFEGSDFPAFLQSIRPLFRTVKALKVTASRDRSKEIYVVCLKKR